MSRRCRRSYPQHLKLGYELREGPCASERAHSLRCCCAPPLKVIDFCAFSTFALCSIESKFIFWPCSRRALTSFSEFKIVFAESRLPAHRVRNVKNCSMLKAGTHRQYRSCRNLAGHFPPTFIFHDFCCASSSPPSSLTNLALGTASLGHRILQPLRWRHLSPRFANEF